MRMCNPVPLLAALLLLGCLSDHGGSDTETLLPVLLAADGAPAAGARVRLVPADYDPSQPRPASIRTATADAQGRYAFPSGLTGAYNLIASGDGDEAVFLAGVAASSLPDTLSLETARVVFVSLHGDGYTQADSGKAWFPGSDIFVRCEVDTATKLERLPRGLDGMVIESRAGWRHEYQITNPADSLVIKADRFGVQCNPYGQ